MDKVSAIMPKASNKGLYNKVKELMMGKAMSEGLRISGTITTLIALHIIPESQLDSFNWQKKNNAVKKSRKKKYLSASLVGWTGSWKNLTGPGPEQGREQPQPKNACSAFNNSKILRLLHHLHILPFHQRWGPMQAPTQYRLCLLCEALHQHAHMEREVCLRSLFSVSK